MIDLLPSAEQQLLADSVARFLTATLPVARHRRGATGAIDGHAWQELAGMGLMGMTLDEAAGGMGYSPAEEVLVFRELGRQLAPLDILAGAIGARIAAFAGARELAHGIIQGGVRLALALPDAAADAPALGTAPLTVIGPAGAELVVACREDRSVLVRRDAFGAAETLHAIDPSIALHRLAGAGEAPPVAAAGAEIALALLLLTAALHVGSAEAARDMAVTYAGQREQFGEKIGGFQAIKHICADMALRAEAAWSQAVFAALSPAVGAEARREILAAQLVALDAAQRNAAANVQVHGGIGFTTECDAHLFVKRSAVLAQLVGGPKRYQQQLALSARPSYERATQGKKTTGGS